MPVSNPTNAVTSLNWTAYPLSNGWRDFSVTTDSSYPTPVYARSGTIVFIKGAFDGALATGALGALPADCRPTKRARLLASLPTGIAALELRADGTLRDTAGGDLSTTAYIILNVSYDLG